MTREFFIYTADDESCAVKDDSTGMVYKFSDILEAIAYVRGQRGGEVVQVTCFGPAGDVVFSDDI